MLNTLYIKIENQILEYLVLVMEKRKMQTIFELQKMK